MKDGSGMRGGILGRASGFWKGCWSRIGVGQSPAFGFVCVALFFLKSNKSSKAVLNHRSLLAESVRDGQDW